MAWSQRQQAGEAVSQSKTADYKHQSAHIRHAARRARHCGGIGEDRSGDSER